MLLKCSIPVAVGCATIYGLWVGGASFTILASDAIAQLNTFTLLAVPFFILVGGFMSRGTMAQRLLDFIMVMVGGRREAIAIATIIACAFFAALCGSAVATVAAIGAITIPMMVDQGYKKEYATSIAAAGAIVGPIIPPSVIMCIYGIQTSTSITELFMGGMIPGILMTVGFLITFTLTKRRAGNIDWNHKGDYKARYTAKEKWQAFWKAKWALMMPVIVLGGIYSGIFTPTESAIIACVYALFVGFFIERDLTLKEVLLSFKMTIMSMGGLMILLAFAAVFGKMLTLLQIPQHLSEAILSLTTNKFLLLLLVNVIFLIAGCFLEAGAAIVILTPVVLPVVESLGISRLAFGVFMCVNLVIGTLTPPFGTNLFMGSSISGVPALTIAKKCIPFMISSLAVLMLITYVPGIIEFLPNLLYGK